jgi:hypothetical protein
MVSNSNKPGLPKFFADSKSTQGIRKQFIEEPAKAAQQAAFAPALELVELFSLLPDAFARSQQRELARLKSSKKDNDSRVAALEASIANAETMTSIARRGEVRFQRSLVALATDENVFHGFVSDPKLNPLKGLTVRLSRSAEKGSKQLSATTEEDGYFLIPLGKRGDKLHETEEDGYDVTPEKIAELFARQQKEPGTYEPAGDSRESTIQILRKSHLLYEDPVEVDLAAGTVYREYLITGEEQSFDFDFDRFVVDQKAEAYKRHKTEPEKEPTVDVKPAAAPRSRAVKKKAAKKKSTKRSKK